MFNSAPKYVSFLIYKLKHFQNIQESHLLKHIYALLVIICMYPMCKYFGMANWYMYNESNFYFRLISKNLYLTLCIVSIPHFVYTLKFYFNNSNENKKKAWITLRLKTQKKLAWAFWHEVCRKIKPRDIISEPCCFVLKRHSFF